MIGLWQGIASIGVVSEVDGFPGMKPLELDEIVAVLAAQPMGPVGRQLVTGVSTDSRHVASGDLFFALSGERFDGHRFVGAALDQGAMAAVISDAGRIEPDLREMGLLLLVDDVTAALGRLAAYHRHRVRAGVIAVTGSNGKTTTKEMIHQVLGGRFRGRAAIKSFNNAVGVPLTLLSAEPADDYVVVEIGTNAPGEIAQLSAIAEPDIAVITSVSETHLEKLKDLKGVASEKATIVEYVREGGCAIINGESDLLVSQVRRRLEPGDRVIRYGRRDDVDLRISDVVTQADHVSFRVNDDLKVNLPIPGSHNALNALAALAVGRELGVSPAEGVARLSEFHPPDMRLETHRWGTITFINDAYNANPASMAAALEVLAAWPGGCRRVFVAGQMRELGAASLDKHQELGRRAGESGVEVLIAVGESADEVVSNARQVNSLILTESCEDTDDASLRLRRLVEPGDVILIKGSRAVGLEALVSTIQGIAQGVDGKP